MKPDGMRIVFRPEYVDLLKGDHLAALMLGQIVYWYLPNKDGLSKLRVEKHGQWWLVKSNVDWERELRLTRRQSQRCLDVLREGKHIVTERYMFNGHPTVHLRLRLVVGNLIPIERLDAFHCTLLSNPLHAEVQCITETTTEITSILKEANEFATETEAALVNVHEALAKVKGQKPESKATPASLAMLWKKRVGTLTGAYVKELTAKDMGQLKHLVKGLGPKAVEVMDWALQNWSTFCWETKIKKGLKSAPELPNIGFMVQYHDVAAMLVDAPTKIALTKPVKVAVPVLDKPVVMADTESSPQASADDVLATLALIDQMSGS